MKKSGNKIDKLFKAAHFAAANNNAPVFSAEWQSRLMNEIGYLGRLSSSSRNDETSLNIFAFRLGWAMLGFAFTAVALLYFTGIAPLYKVPESNRTSLLEMVDQSVNVYDVNFFDKTSGAGKGDEK